MSRAPAVIASVILSVVFSIVATRAAATFVAHWTMPTHSASLEMLIQTVMLAAVYGVLIWRFALTLLAHRDPDATVPVTVTARIEIAAPATRHLSLVPSTR